MNNIKDHQYLDLKNDYAFKKVFGSKQSKNILIDFLNSILKLDTNIIDLNIENPYNFKELDEGKDTYVDVKATAEFKLESPL